MRNVVIFCVSIFLELAVLPAPGVSQDSGSTRPSPSARANCAFADGKTISVDYSSPRMRGRKIYGGLVPYGQVWRTGANDATTLVSNTNLTVGGKEVPAGRYTLFTVPGPNTWPLIISTKTGEWGIPYPGARFDLMRTDMHVSKLPSTVENFTIAFDQAGTRCTMRLDWETTRATVDMIEK